MELIKRDPNTGYLDRWLWLPRSQVSEGQIKGALLFKQGGGLFVKGWRDEKDHILVPRNFLRPGAIGKLAYPVIDTRILKFPSIKIRSKVVLDKQAPHLSFQRDGVAALQGTYDGILCLRCGAGKTVCALHAAAALKTPILVIVDEDGLMQQWKAAVANCLELEDPVVGIVGGGKFDWEHDVVIASVRTLARRAREGGLPPAMTRRFGVIIPDECQVMGAPYFNSALPEFHGRRWGLSATPHREDQYDPLLRFSLGPVVFTYLEPESKPHFYFLRLPTKNFSREEEERVYTVAERFHFTSSYGVLAERDTRTELIAHDIRLAVKKGRTVLVLSQSVRMCEALAVALPEAGLITGKVSGKKRMTILAGKNPVICIMKIGEKALDKANLDTIFIVDPLAKSGRLQQLMGRALRLKADKKRPVVIAIEDHEIGPLRGLCNKMRRLLARWPDDQGGAIPFSTITPGHENGNDQKLLPDRPKRRGALRGPGLR